MKGTYIPRDLFKIMDHGTRAHLIGGMGDLGEFGMFG